VTSSPALRDINSSYRSNPSDAIQRGCHAALSQRAHHKRSGAFLGRWVSGLGGRLYGGLPLTAAAGYRDRSVKATDLGSTVLDLGMLDLEEIATALQYQDSWGHCWLIDPQSGQIGFALPSSHDRADERSPTRERDTIVHVPNALDFTVVPVGDGARALVPMIDGQSLVDLVAAFEAQRAYEPSGGYAGIIPAHFNFGVLTRYYEAREDRQWPSPQHAWLLGCDCGEVGCWPLTARIEVTADDVTWSDFGQPHRPGWDYEGFGPFVFERQQYAGAVSRAVEAVG
jgi:hypothetical protein